MLARRLFTFIKVMGALSALHDVFPHVLLFTRFTCPALSHTAGDSITGGPYLHACFGLVII
jgi:hypothetical protein